MEEKEGIPPPQQRLIFSGKQMNDEKTAADYKVCQHFTFSETIANSIIILLSGSRRLSSSSRAGVEGRTVLN